MPQPRSTIDRTAADPAELFRLHARTLERRIQARVRTSEQNVQDACSFAWMQLLTHTVEGDEILGWLITVATHQALRLHQRSQRTSALPQDEFGETIEPIDPADPIGSRERLIDAVALLELAKLTDRQRRMIALQAAGYSYTDIAAHTGNSLLTVQRQLLRAHRRIRKARGG